MLCVHLDQLRNTCQVHFHIFTLKCHLHFKVGVCMCVWCVCAPITVVKTSGITLHVIDLKIFPTTTTTTTTERTYYYCKYDTLKF